MIFPFSFRRAYLAKVTGGAITTVTSGTTDTIGAGQFGLCTAPNGIEGSFISGGTGTTLKLVTGSWHTVDKIAPFYGGLQAPYYSKAIDPRRITRFIYSKAAPAQQQVVAVGWNQLSGSTVGPVFYCGTSYFLRIDLLGSPALRLLNRQLYISLPAYGGCCGTDCSSGCTSTAVDAAFIMLQWKDFILSGNGNNIPEIPYLQQMFLPAVFIQSGSTKVQVFSQADSDAGRIPAGGSVYVPNTSNPTSVVASFQLTGAYFQTNYGDCTFTPSDYFEIEPLFCKTSLMSSDFSGPDGFAPCSFNTTINTSVPNLFTELQAAVYPKGLGEQVAREIIQSERYRQDHFADSVRVDSFRMREIEDQSWILNNVSRQGYYDSIAIVYNINRPQNTQSLNDNDEYTEIIYVPGTYVAPTYQNTTSANGWTGGSYTSATVTSLTNIISACLTAVGSSVTLETTAANGSGI
jgi:hypothetical protein